ncbi:hypothetical protein LUZ63_001276 [Rhynchospora breviuscula]|uniref:non-specific serine/threonine protein kinase n=1 Tax=Rhynchospora breviuscula TaxID=2022672 RepID=A0A9Q0CXH4_9POAL|nr:hypothetical protein LUZ63_001276 [Rhynchospora breviuscula]
MTNHSPEAGASLETLKRIGQSIWGWLRLRTMGSALVRLNLKQRSNGEDLQKKRKDRERVFATWHCGTKGDGTAPQLNGARYVSFEELKKCTNNFSETNLIGEGGYGKVYKGCCTNGVAVAIKRRSKKSLQGKKEFESEIEVLSRVHHKNIVSLLGFCCEQGEELLVYEYISNGTLIDNLIGKGGVYLDWDQRLQIALDSARALSYLHELVDPLIIHRDLKPTNILLDENFNANVTDFGLSKMVSEKEKGHDSSKDIGTGRTVTRVQSMVMGTHGYADPEYIKTGFFSEKSDAYGFGTVMLELITARPSIDRRTEMHNYLVEEVKSAIDEDDQEYYGLRDLIDPKIVNQVTSVGFIKFVQLALQCLKDFGSDRPSMYEIMKEIDIILQHDRSE